MRVLAVDYGTVRVGLALSDELGLFATPLETQPYRADIVERIASIASAHTVATVVVGMPYALDGTESDMTRRVKSFAERLRAVLPCPVVEWDESFSSRAAAQRMRGTGVGRRRRRSKGTTDAWAASIILEEYLESLR